MPATLNQPIKDLRFQATQGTALSFSDLRGKNIVLYFYPKDRTPVCTIESWGFRNHHSEFEALNTVVFGVSRDSLASHERFKEKHAFPFELISDAAEELMEYFAVIKQKSLLGKKYKGVERSTFLIDKEGVLRTEWRNVKIRGHVAEVLEAVRRLSNQS